MPNKFTFKFTVVTFLLFSVNSVKSQLEFHRNDTVEVYKSGVKLDLAWSGGMNSSQFSKVDLNLDGIDDLVVFDRADHKVLTFINNGTANQTDYTYAYQYEKNFPEVSNWLLMRDFNFDGKIDIICHANAGFKVYKNISTLSSGLKFELYNPLVKSLQYPGGFFNLYVSSVDIPSITDVDGDGDLDVLTFSLVGSYVEYHKNMSIENYGHADSLDFVLKNNCWGYFAETGSSTNKLSLYDTCSDNVPNPQRENRHSGSTVMAFDNNGDGVTDILLGDVSFNNVVLATNGGTSPNMNSAIISQDTAFPSYDTPIDLSIFPAMFYEDVDNDNIKDLICSPNTTVLTENYESIYFYKNNGDNSNPVFNYVKNDLLQDESIDLGEGSNTAFFDHNGDGLMDMIVSSYGRFVKSNNSYDSKLSLFENTGTSTNPVFTFVTDDYQSIFALNLGQSLYPTFGDIDNDGDFDMLIGDSEGKLHFFTNTAGVGNVAAFTLTTQNVTDVTSIPIDVGQFATPQLFDYDNDNDLDLIIGEKNGIVNYYENIGNQTTYSFSFVTDSLGKVEIHEPWDIFGSSTGYSSPFLFNELGTTYMVSGGQKGDVYLYSNINPNDPNSPFLLADTIIKRNELGLQTTPHVVDINNNGQVDMFVGQLRGGLACFYAGRDVTKIEKVNNQDININLYPNPTKNSIKVSIKSDYETKSINYNIFNVLGERVGGDIIKSNYTTTLSVNNLKNGIYFMNFIKGEKSFTKRFVISR